MQSIKLSKKVGADGILHLDIPVETGVLLAPHELTRLWDGDNTGD